MADLQVRKVQPTRLRDAGLDERWLQDQIAADPAILGLGDLHLIQKEKPQPTGGKIDFLMYDEDSGTRYEIEVMLGATNESHIIRTIEYWDIERQRYPTLDHRAVIVAEEITARFFNVIRLLNRAVPIIAIQLSAFVIEGAIVLHFTRVLDIYEFGDDVDDGTESAERVDRAYWEKRATPALLQVVDGLASLVPTAQGEPKLAYTKSYIALATSGYNFLWFNWKRLSSHWHIRVVVDPDARPAIIEKLEAGGIEASSKGRKSIRFPLGKKEIDESRAVLQEVLRVAEKWSHR